MTAPQRRRPPREVVFMRVLDPARIRRERMSRMLSQRELARRCKRTHTALGKIESGVTDRIAEPFAMALAHQLGFRYQEVFADLDGPEVMPEDVLGSRTETESELAS